MTNSPNNILTNRERDVLIYVARGYTNHEIADELCTSTSAVKVFLHQAYVKMGARNRAGAVVQAIKRGGIAPQDIFSQDELVELLTALGPDSIQMIARIVKQKHQTVEQLIDSLEPEVLQMIARRARQKLDISDG